MAAPKYLKCDCSICGGHIEFPADGIGTTIPCPHCGAETELTLPAPDMPALSASRGYKWALAGLIILVAGVVGVLVALNMAQRLRKSGPRASTTVTRPGHPSATPSMTVHTNNFTSSAVKIEAQPGSTLVYALGTLTNQLPTQRFGVTVELDLFDAAGRKVGTARDYREIIEARGEWKFRALLVIPDVTSARVSSAREQL